jgi:uncharacterized protein YfaS (alpha-2-macroglobulin family)
MTRLPPQKFLIPGLVTLAILVAGIVAWRSGPMSPAASNSGGAMGERAVRIAEDSPLMVLFPVPMDEKSVEENIAIEPELEGGMEWTDRQSLAFHPSSPLSRSGTYTLTVAPEAMRRDKAVLGRAITVRYFVAGPPRVQQQLPPPEYETADLHQTIMIVFDRPMVALTTISQRGVQLADWPVKITPAISGTWKWLSTTTAEFSPKNGLAPAMKYTVEVPAGIKTINGEVTTEDFSWSFTTQGPKLMESVPISGVRSISPKEAIILTFNQDIDLESAKAHIALVAAKKPGVIEKDEQMTAMQQMTPDPAIVSSVPVKVAYGTSEVNGKKVQDRKKIIVQPEADLVLNTWHVLLADKGILTTSGPMGTAQEDVVMFQTAGPMQVYSVHEESSQIVLNFSNPYDASSIKKGVTISPKPQGWDDLTLEDNVWEGTTLYLYPTLEPSTTYTISANSNLKDIYGQGVASGKTLTLKTKPMQPRLFIHGKGNFGIFEKGFPPVYYLNAVNVKKMEVEFAKLSLTEFLAEQRAGLSSWQHVPKLKNKDMYRHWSIDTNAKENQWKSTPFDVEEMVGASLPAGIYALTLTAPEYRDEYSAGQYTEKIYFTTSSTALTLKYSGHQALVWAKDMSTGAPVKGATIGLHDLQGKTKITGATDAEGFFETQINAEDFAVDGNTWNPELWVSAQTPTDFAFVGSSWTTGISGYDFGTAEEWTPSKDGLWLMSEIYTDRPIYRTGDTVHFKGILRLKDKHGVLLPPNTSRRAAVRIDDANGNNIFSEILPINGYGSFSGEFPIDAKASLGSYWLNVQLDDSADIVNNYSSTSFQVLAYRKPEFSVDVTFDKEDYYANDTAHAKVKSAYYFGMPMNEATVSWRALYTDYFFNRYTDGWYSFSLEDSWCWYNCERASGIFSNSEGTLKPDGTLSVDIPLLLDDKALSQVLSLDVDVTDESNQIVSTRASVPVHKAGVYVGIRPEEYAIEPGQEAPIGLVTVRPDGSPIGGQRIDLTVFKRTWNTTVKKGIDGEYIYDNTPKDDKISTLSVTTDGDGKATAKVQIPSGGQFRVLALVRDQSGREAKADTSVYAWSSTYVNWPHNNNNRMTVLADKPEYRVGDTAKLLMQSPFQGDNVSALVTIEREGIIRRTVIPVSSAAQSIDIPITEDLIPNAYVSVIVFKPRIGETFNENGLDTGAPAFRIGYAKLKVENASKELTVSIAPDKRRYLPGETVSVTLSTEDHSGKPVSGEVSLSVVDMSVLALTGYRLPNLLLTFYSERGLGVRTAVNLLYLLERFKPGSKGGGGGDLEQRARGTFKDTAYWNPSIITDANGRATVTFTLPDNLTTWKLIAIAHTKDSLVGSQATEVLETKRVIVRPVRPRFAVHSDKAELAAIVHNGTEERQTFTVHLTGKGFTPNDASQTVTVGPEGQEKVLFPVTFGYGEEASFVFTAETDGMRDEVHESIPLFPFGIPQSTATSGFTEVSTVEKIFVPVDEEITSLTATATLSPSLATYLPLGLQYLVKFPYGCAEQTTSSFLPNVAVGTLQGFDAFRIVSDKELKEKITAGIERLLTFQQSDGGFGYWADSRESNVNLTAYVLHALHLTMKAGYAVDADILSRARNYLGKALRSRPYERLADVSERAYVLYVLGETGGSDESLLSNLYAKRESLSLFGTAYLSMSLEKAGDHRRASSLLQDILTKAKVHPRGVTFEEQDSRWFHGLMNTNQRTTALVLQAMLRINPENVLTPKIVRGMLSTRENGHWDTTQSTTASIFALVDYLKYTKELDGDFSATLSIQGSEIGKAIFDASTILSKKELSVSEKTFENGQFNTVDIAKEGTGRLYYDLLLSYFWKTREIHPAEEGISVTREVVPVSGSPLRPTVGGTYKVQLTITVPEERHFVAVESPHPAGYEGIDFALQTNQKYLEGETNIYERQGWWWDPLWFFTHKEFRDDQVFLFAEDLPAGVYKYEYLVRATLPGTYLWRPARAYEMYFPEVFGNTESQVVEIRGAE